MSDGDKKIGDDSDEEVIWGWILEFLARKEKDGLVKNLMVGKYLPVPDRDLRLKKTILLRSIQSEIERPSERILDYLEHVRELDHAQGVGVSESMKSAYCAVAVEATVKFLEGSVGDRSSYFDAVVRIWQDRIRNLLYFEDTNGVGGLLSDQLSNWKADIEAALWNTNVCRMLLGKYRKIGAARLLRVYLKETWESMGPTFLELAASSSAAQAVILDSNSIYNAAHSGVTPGCGASACGRAATQGPQEQVQVQGLAMDPIHITIPPLSPECEQNSFPVRTTTPSTEEASPNVNQNSPLADSGAPEDGRGTEMKKKDVLCKLKHVASGDRRIHRAMPTKGRGIKIRDTEELDNETLSEKYNSVSAAHVHKAKAALMSSSLELKAAVKDPLPQAMRIAETLLGHMASKGITHEPQVENQCIDNANVPAHASNAVSEALQANENSSRDLCCEADQANDGNPVNVRAEAAQANEDKPGIQGCQRQTIVPRPSLMARNSTAHISQWDDSDDTSPARLHLPSPRRTVISPLKRYEMKRIPRRRQNKRWSLIEEDTLRDAVHKHGKGNWKLILTIYADIFEERTEVDLKDKWRNMIR